MNSWHNLWGLLGNRAEVPTTPVVDHEKADRRYVPTAVAGPATSVQHSDYTKRTSVTDVTPASLNMRSGTIIAPLNFNASSWYELEYLSKHDPHISYAVHNISTLGNTPFNISFSEGISDDVIQELHEVIRVDFPNVYPGGLVGLRNQMYRQLAIYGALSHELLVKRDLSGLGGVALVNPKNIRFYYDQKTNRFVPVQVHFAYAPEHAKYSPHGYIELNPYTYKYVPMDTDNDSPYGIPPLLAAIDTAAVDKDLTNKYKAMIKAVGLMGFLRATVNPGADFGLTQTIDGYGGYGASTSYNPEVAQAARNEKVTKLLKETASVLSDAVETGILVGVEGTHNFSFDAPAINVEAAMGIQSMNTAKKVAGVKQPGLMLGVDTGTTETLGRILMAKATASIKLYQALVDEQIGYIVRSHLVLKGYYVKYVMVESTPPIIGDEVRDAQAFDQRVETAIKLYNQGIISQSQLAQTLGYDKPAEKGPVAPVAVAKGPSTKRDEMPAGQQGRNNNPTGGRTTDATYQRRT